MQLPVLGIREKIGLAPFEIKILRIERSENGKNYSIMLCEM